ncbi:apolipoprotein N-acyltransferase, partial [Paraburkholderia sp. SIMBA_050]
EWLRGTVLTGFPWLASGYAQVDGPFAGFAPVVGVYGIGWVLALFAALVVQALVAARRSPAPEHTDGNARIRIAAPAGVAVALVAAGIGLSQA